MELYRTVKKRASTESVVERSRFVAHISPVQTREEAEAFIAGIRKEYKDATHNVPAMVIGDKQQLQWASDDGEPQGTSGAPMVQLMVSEGLTDLVVVVTRYFGGIKLGTGGLVRAYSSAAREAIDEAGICRVCSIGSIRARTDYSSYERVRKSASKELTDQNDSFVIDDIEYTDRVSFTALTQEENREYLEKRLTDLTNGTFEILDISTVLREMDL